MSTNSRWVRVHLETYCGPGRHEYRDAGGGVAWCVRCFKEERPGETCAICDSAGRHAVTLGTPGGVRLPACVCATCLNGLREAERPGWDVVESNDP